MGVNPWGLPPNDIWQLYVTHVSTFGKLRFVHISIDTFSDMIFASGHTGEKLEMLKVIACRHLHI